MSQSFSADVEDYLAAMDELIAKNRDVITSIGEVQTAIDGLHDREVKVTLNEDEVLEQVAYIREVLAGIPDEKTIRVNTIYSNEGGTGDAADAVNNLTDELNRQAEAWSRVEDVGRDYSVMMGEVIADANETSGALDRVFAVSSDGAAEMKSASDAVKDFDAGLRIMHGSLDAAAISMLGLGEDTAKADAAATTVAGTFAKNVAGFTAWGIGWQGLHWILMGTTEILATLIPATIALGAGLAAGAEGAQWIANKLQGVYTASEATSQMLGQTAGNALGLQSTLQQAQTAADPGVYELLGAALNGAKSQFFNFGAEGVSVIHMLDAFAAKIDVELAGSVGGQLHKMLGTGVSDLQAWGAVLGNIGHMILNLASEMPGLAEVLIHVLSAFTGFLNMLSGISPGLVTFAMGLEETWRWGGKVAEMAGVLLSSFGGLATKIGSAAGALATMGDMSKLTGVRTALLGVESGGEGRRGGWSRLPGSWRDRGAGSLPGLRSALGLLIDKLVTAQTAAERFTSNMETAINKANFTQGLTDILTDLPILQETLMG